MMGKHAAALRYLDDVDVNRFHPFMIYRLSDFNYVLCVYNSIKLR